MSHESQSTPPSPSSTTAAASHITMCCNEKCRSTTETQWRGKLPYRYCRKPACLELGVRLGHITQRKKRARADADAEDGDLVLLEQIYGCRSCDPTALDDVDFRNGVHEDDRALQLLVHGKFQKDERDIRGFNAMRWLSLEQLHDALGDEVLTAALAKYEAAVRNGIASRMNRMA